MNFGDPLLRQTFVDLPLFQQRYLIIKVKNTCYKLLSSPLESKTIGEQQVDGEFHLKVPQLYHTKHGYTNVDHIGVVQTLCLRLVIDVFIHPSIYQFIYWSVYPIWSNLSLSDLIYYCNVHQT